MEKEKREALPLSLPMLPGDSEIAAPSGWQTWRLDPAELVTPRMTAANGLTFGSGQYGPAGGGAVPHENLLHVKPPQPLRTEGAPKAVVPEQ